MKNKIISDFVKLQRLLNESNDLSSNDEKLGVVRALKNTAADTRAISIVRKSVNNQIDLTKLTPEELEFLSSLKNLPSSSIGMLDSYTKSLWYSLHNDPKVANRISLLRAVKDVEQTISKNKGLILGGGGLALSSYIGSSVLLDVLKDRYYKALSKGDEETAKKIKRKIALVKVLKLLGAGGGLVMTLYGIARSKF